MQMKESVRDLFQELTRQKQKEHHVPSDVLTHDLLIEPEYVIEYMSGLRQNRQTDQGHSTGSINQAKTSNFKTLSGTLCCLTVQAV